MSNKTKLPLPFGLHYPWAYAPKDKEKNAAIHATNFLTRMLSAFEWKGLPDTIPQRYMERYLLTDGQCYVTEVNGALYALNGTLGGEPDPYYIPKQYVVANVGLNLSKTFDREKDGVLVRNDDLMIGVMPIISRYSAALTENELTLFIADLNMRIAFIMSSGDDDAKASAKEFLKQIEAGNLGVIGDAAVFEGLKVQPGGIGSQGYLSQLIEYEQFLKASCYNDLGVDLNFNMKRESITAGEANQNEPGLYTLIDNMLKCRQEAAEQINAKYGTEITVDKASAWKIEQEQTDVEIEAEKESVDESAGDSADNGGEEEVKDNETE